MKHQQIAAFFFTLIAFMAMSCAFVFFGILSEVCISASAGDAIYGYVTVDSVLYAIYGNSSTQYASVVGVASDLQILNVPATIPYNGQSVPVTKIVAASSVQMRSLDLSAAANLTEICSDAFNGSPLTYCSIGCASATQCLTVDANAFADSSIRHLIVSSPSISIQSNAFARCNSLQDVVFCTNVREITLGDFAFAGLMNLTDVGILNRTVTLVLGEYTFSGCALQTFRVDPNIQLSVIPEGCFQYCNMTAFSIPRSVTELHALAFYGATLPSVVSLGGNLKYVDSTAFLNIQNTASFIADAGCTAVKTVDGVLYSCDEKTLFCYPPQKKNISFVCQATVIPAGALMNNAYLRSLSIAKYQYDEDTAGMIYGFPNLEELTVSKTEYSHSAATFLKHWGELCSHNHVHRINGKEMVVSHLLYGEPQFNSKFRSYLNAHFEDYSEAGFMKQYIDKMAEYVVQKVTKDDMSDFEKAVKLHEWILKRVTYDPNVLEYENIKAAGGEPDESLDSKKNHVAASVFLHKRDGVRYSVCEGYAKCYTILMNKAGIEAYQVRGVNSNPKGSGHAWNMVRLGGNWYHVDCCWDDREYDNGTSDYYKYFLRTDAAFQSDSHKKYFWSLTDVPYGVYLPNAVMDLTDQDDNPLELSVMLSLIGKTVGTDANLIYADLDLDGMITQNDYDLLCDYYSADVKNGMQTTLRGFVLDLFEN